MARFSLLHNASERWRRAERLYYRLRACPPIERRLALELSCSDDPDLRREVESLLEAREKAGSFLSPSHLRPYIATFGSLTAAPALGSAVGPYQLVSLLGIGGMGEVYRARDARLARDVALKLLPAHVTHEAASVARFQQEARSASALNHTNIVTIYDIGESGGTWFIATELIEGVTLRQRILGGKLTIEESLHVILQCSGALNAAHRAGIVHSDIKPENIMLRPDGIIKLVDFGLARITRAGSAERVEVTHATGVMGTPRYMSPEQARGEKLDGRSDLFSLGAVLYEMLAGRPAFSGTSTAEVFAALLERDPAPLGCILDSVLSKALQKRRENRYQTIEEFLTDLRRLNPSCIPSLRGIGQSSLRRGLVLATIAAALAVTAQMALSGYRWAGARRGLADAQMSFVPLTSFTGPKDFAAFSPDGARIAFSWSGGREGVLERHIYVKPVGKGDPIQLTSAAEDDILPAWSPDGSSIAFLRRVHGASYGVYIVPSAGGMERRIASGNRGVCWSPDGKWLALASLPDQPDGSAGLFLISLDTGERRELTSPQRGQDEFPVYSPNGQWVAFMRKRSERDVFIVPARGGAAKQLTFDSRPKLGAPTWTVDNRELVYSTQREFGGEGLWRIAIRGGKPRRLWGALQFAGNPNISRKGDRLAYTESWIDTNIYLSEGPGFSKSGAPGQFAQPKKVIGSSREDHSPSFSPDGQRIAFVSNRSGQSEIWTSRRDGGEPMQLTNFERFTGTPRWSPDGQWIVFDAIINRNSDLWLIPAAGGLPRQLTSDPAEASLPSWSPDGAWIYFNSARSGSSQLWKIKPDGSAATQVTWDGAREPLPAADGRSVYYTKQRNGAAIWSVQVTRGSEQPLAGMEAFGTVQRAWGVLARGIYFVSEEQGASRDRIRFFSFAAGRVIPLTVWQVRAQWSGPAVAISSDGRYLLTVRTDQQVNDLMMIKGFR